ncbi:MAG: response regulator [Herbinix sp.]|jgi:DNA-binding response OmpR family regulator|nr:response regulator [Herbinix sp.]
MFKIAVIEDDVQLCNLISDVLSRYGYEIVKEFNYRNLTAELLNTEPHLILLDINLPYYDGYHIARELRQKSDIPIIMISARGTEAEQIRGFDLGADDYVVKPFSMEMLKVKINACLRRTYSTMNEQEIISIGALTINKKNFTLSYLGQNVELTKNEMKIIVALAENANGIVKRDFLLNELWDDLTFVEDNTLTVNITRIKNKLSKIGLNDVIHTKRGEGYILSL